MSIRIIVVNGCASCPHKEYHYGEHTCEKMGGKSVVSKGEKAPDNHQPNWCPLPDHPTANH